jgi:hypothetical protein
MKIQSRNVLALKHNGPAIKGGCGTWRSHPATYPGTLAVIYPGGKPGMARVFAVMVQILLSITSVAPCPAEAKRKRGYKFSDGRVFIRVDEVGKGQRRSVAV